MNYNSIIHVLPFWILSLPLVVAIISLIRLRNQHDLTSLGEDRNNVR